ncbi:MAG: lipoyl(octanoyl) transferase LipB [Spirochaetaceae bacterium]|jgi:lipoyl(octanoyl) transferase|nr:lipoyl(octanoyl) transferase LipB [Spirochaetaceae bacterium]
MEEKKLNVIYAGRLSYSDALEMQLQTQKSRLENKIEDTIIFVEHPPVLTTGRRDQSHNIFIDPAAVGAELVKTNRGGEVTYHGPGQIVGYVILDLNQYKKGIKSFVFDLEEVFIRLLIEKYSISSYRDKKHRGVWVDDAKITAVGLAVNHGITMHGFAFNVNTDLSHFEWIVPCGIQGKAVTSLEKLTGKVLDMAVVQQEILEYFKDVFNYL